MIIQSNSEPYITLIFVVNQCLLRSFKREAVKDNKNFQRVPGPSCSCLLTPVMSSTPSGTSFKDHVVGGIPHLLSNIVSSSADNVPAEADIDRLKKEVDDFYNATRKQANRYQRDLENLSSRHGTADQARRRDVQKSTARHEEGEYPAPHFAPCFRANRILMNRFWI